MYNTTEWQNMRKKTKYAPLHLCSDISDYILIQQGRSNELDVQNEWEENTHTHEWHRMTRMTGPDCVVMCNLINTHTLGALERFALGTWGLC